MQSEIVKFGLSDCEDCEDCEDCNRSLLSEKISF